MEHVYDVCHSLHWLCCSDIGSSNEPAAHQLLEYVADGVSDNGACN